MRRSSSRSSSLIESLAAPGCFFVLISVPLVRDLTCGLLGGELLHQSRHHRFSFRSKQGKAMVTHLFRELAGWNRSPGRKSKAAMMAPPAAITAVHQNAVS